MKTFSLSVIILLLSFNLAQAQKDNFIYRYFNRLLYDTSDISRPQFLAYPTVAYAPETSWEFGISSLYVFYAKRDTTNRLSEISGFTFFTLENQFGLWFDHAFYSHQNKWFILGRFRLQSYPLLYHGIGSDTPPDPLAVVDGNLLQIRERLLRKIYGNFYAGMEADYQRLSSVEFESVSGIQFERPRGHHGSANLGLGIGFLYDDRHNVLNVRHGNFSELAFLHYDDIWGSDFTFTSVISDSRIYRPVNKRDVFAAQLLGQFNLGHPPFNQLALKGGESIMRGYYTGRFRDRNQLAGQIEYRFLPLPLGFSKRFGAAVFAGTGAVFHSFRTLSIDDFVLSGGAGIRFLLFPKKDIFTRFDAAFTREGPGFYIFIGEAF